MYTRSYLENDGDHLTVRPWVWIGLLFLGPVLGSLSFQWYIYTAVGLSPSDIRDED